MEFLWIGLGIAAFIAVAILIIAYICFRMVFYEPRKQKLSSDELPVPEGEIYEPYHPIMKKWILEARNYPHEDYYIQMGLYKYFLEYIYYYVLYLLFQQIVLLLLVQIFQN